MVHMFWCWHSWPGILEENKHRILTLHPPMTIPKSIYFFELLFFFFFFTSTLGNCSFVVGGGPAIMTIKPWPTSCLVDVGLTFKRVTNYVLENEVHQYFLFLNKVSQPVENKNTITRSNCLDQTRSRGRDQPSIKILPIIKCCFL